MTSLRGRVMRDNREWLVLFLAFTLLGLCIIAFALNATAQPDDIPMAPGTPLDAITYETPEWMPSCHRCQRVTDRITGQSWWVLSVSGGEYVVLPITTDGDMEWTSNS